MMTGIHQVLKINITNCFIIVHKFELPFILPVSQITEHVIRVLVLEIKITKVIAQVQTSYVRSPDMHAAMKPLPLKGVDRSIRAIEAVSSVVLILHLDVSVRAFRLCGRFRGLDSSFLGSIKAFSYLAVFAF